MRYVCLSIALALACPAAAQTRKPAKEPAPNVQKFDFDNDIVEAGVDLPQAEVVTSAGRVDFRSLIRVRTTFVPELVESARRR
jgi:hypothetical protein